MSENNKVIYFAKTIWRGKEIKFGIKLKNRKSHIYIIGKTGTGKSTLLLNMMVADILAGNGFCLIEPHGDLSEEILNFIPKERIKDVIYFNVCDLNYPIGFNPLEKSNSESSFLIASSLISIFKKIWYEFWGPRLEYILRNSLLTLLEYEGSTLLDLQRLLTNKEFRKKVIGEIKDNQLKQFWLSEFEKYPSFLKTEAVSAILNKVGQFLTNLPIRLIIGQRKSSFDLKEIMDQGKILIVNLSKGKIGEDTSKLLGSMLVSKIEFLALRRAEIEEEKRKTFYLYIDEFQNFLTLSLADILSEARKYGLSLILSHQYLEQLDEKIREAIFGNVGTIISFRVGSFSAKYLAKEFFPNLSETDLVSLPNYHIYLKLMINGKISQGFSAITLPPPKRGISYKEEIIKHSRAKYGRKREEVEREIFYSLSHKHFIK